MTKILKLILFCLCSFLFLLSSKSSVGMGIDTTTIVAGKAKITGKIIIPNKTNKDNISVTINVLHPISGENVKYESLVDQSGRFAIDVDVETTISWIGLKTSLNLEKMLLIKLKSSGVTNINIAYNADIEIKNIDVTPAMNKNDITEGLVLQNKMIDYRSGIAPEPLYNKSTGYFLNYVKDTLSERLEVVNNDAVISKELKELLSKDQRLIVYFLYVFDYEKLMMGNYKNTNADQSKKPDILNIDRTYFRFLKDFNLNDPQYLQCLNFPEFQIQLLQNETLNLPQIGDSYIATWLASVKVILSDLVGFDNGQYYDILAANAYARQLNEEVKPLTEKQKKNIASYWKNGEIAKILFRKNLQIIELDKFKSPAVIIDISTVPDDKVMETIIAKHKNKVVLVDFWATWCGPCLNAMEQFRSTKGEFHDKDVVFVYLTNGSSPRKQWEEKIKGIGSEHYCLTASQWKYVMTQFEFEYIPSYLLYNKESVLINKFQAFPGNEKVKGMIDSLL